MDNGMSNTGFERDIRDDLGNVKTDIQVIKKDVENLKYLYEKLDSALTKLDATSNKLDNLITVQDKSVSSLERLLSERDQAINSKLYEHKTSTERKFEKEEIDRKHASLELKEMIKGMNDASEKIASKVEALEKFRWIILGGVMLISFFAPYIEKLWPH